MELLTIFLESSSGSFEILKHLTIGDISKDVLTAFLLWEIIQLRKDYANLSVHIKTLIDFAIKNNTPTEKK